MAFYSFTAIAQIPVAFETPYIALDQGFNVFTAATDDLEGLLKKLAAADVSVMQVNQLDDHQPIQPEDSLLLPGESVPPLLNLHEENDP